MSKLIFKKQIDSLNYTECKKIVIKYLNMDMSYFFDNCENKKERDEEKVRFVKEVKAVLLGDMPVGDFFENNYMEEYDGESVQSFFKLYEYFLKKE